MEESKSVIVVIAASGLTPEDVIADIFLENGVLKSIDRGVGLDIKIRTVSTGQVGAGGNGEPVFQPIDEHGRGPAYGSRCRKNLLEKTELR